MVGIWVSIGYCSKDGEQHVLHIVGGEEASERPNGRSLVPLYFELDDQSLSCYEAADRIVVSDRSITARFSKNGQNSLELPRTVEFATEKPSRDFKKARTMFNKMKKRKGGEVIQIKETRPRA